MPETNAWTFTLFNSCLTGCLPMRFNWDEIGLNSRNVALFRAWVPGLWGLCSFLDRIVAIFLVTRHVGMFSQSLVFRFEKDDMFSTTHHLSWRKVSCELHAVVDVMMLQAALASGVPRRSKSSSQGKCCKAADYHLGYPLCRGCESTF